jgi:predicted HicB family RNase H-like nuclease
MSLINTLKEVLITLCSSFKEYLQVKKAIFAKTDEASSKYKAEFTRKEKCRIELEKFVRSTEGNQIFNQIKGEIETIIFGTDESTVEKSAEQNRQEQITSLKTELAKFENQKNEKTEQLAKWEKLFTLQNASDIHDKIESLKLDISNIDIQILAIQKDLTNLVSEKLREVNKFDGASVEKDKQNLAKLYTILEEKQKAGGVPSDKLLSTIKTLEDRIAQSTAQPVAQKSIDGKLSVRAAVANILEIKAAELNAQIYSKLNELDLIKDIEDKAIQELMLDETVSLQKTFVKQLETTAKQIRQDNDNAKMLEAYRKAFSSVSPDKISKDKLNQITKLELEVGHIIDSEKQEDFVAKIMLRESFLSEFVQDITEHADQFMYVKERLQNSLTQILSHSSHFKANARLYKYLWKTIPSNYKTFLGCVGITEQNLN